MHRFAGSTNAAADRHLPHSTATEDRQRQGPSPRLQQFLGNHDGIGQKYGHWEMDEE